MGRDEIAAEAAAATAQRAGVWGGWRGSLVLVLGEGGQRQLVCAASSMSAEWLERLSTVFGGYADCVWSGCVIRLLGSAASVTRRCVSTGRSQAALPLPRAWICGGGGGGSCKAGTHLRA